MRQTTSDASGCFRFDSLSFPRGTHFILQARKKREVQMWCCWSIGIPFLLYILLFPFMRIGFVQRWMNRLFPNNPVMILLRPVRMCFNDLLPPLFHGAIFRRSCCFH